jgi:hypothetical protein
MYHVRSVNGQNQGSHGPHTTDTCERAKPTEEGAGEANGLKIDNKVCIGYKGCNGRIANQDFLGTLFGKGVVEILKEYALHHLLPALSQNCCLLQITRYLTSRLKDLQLN